MSDVPCSASIDERKHDAGNAARCRREEQLAAEKAEFIAAQVKELTDKNPLDCFLAFDTGQDELLRALIGSVTLQAMTHTHEQFVRFLEGGATIIAERLWERPDDAGATPRYEWFDEQ